MGLIITIVVAIVVLCILHATLPRVFDALFSGIGVGVVAGIIAVIAHFFVDAITWGGVLIIFIGASIIGFIGYGMKFMAMSDSEFENYQFERDLEANRSRKAWNEAGRRVQEKQRSKHICDNCIYFHEYWDAHASGDGYCHFNSRSSDDLERVYRNQGCRFISSCFKSKY